MRGARRLRPRPALRRRADRDAPERRSATSRSGRTSSPSRPGVEDPAPIIEAIRGYVATDYDYPSNIQAVRDDLEAAKREVMEGVEGDGARRSSQEALDLSLGMNPLTPDHHFYIDQGTNARLRDRADRDRRKLAEAGVLDDAEDVDLPALQRAAPADRRPVGVRRRTTLVSDRRDDREDAAERRPPSWVGTATQSALDFPYDGALGLPREVLRRRAVDDRRDQGPGRVARRGRGPGALRRPRSDEFDQVAGGRDPRVPDDQPGLGRAVHEDRRAWSPRPAARRRTRRSWRASSGSRPSSAPTNAGERIKTGDRVRVNGTTGVVEILGRDPGAGLAWRPASLEEALALEAEHGDERDGARRAGRSWAS